MLNKTEKIRQIIENGRYLSPIKYTYTNKKAISISPIYRDNSIWHIDPSLVCSLQADDITSFSLLLAAWILILPAIRLAGSCRHSAADAILWARVMCICFVVDGTGSCRLQVFGVWRCRHESRQVRLEFFDYTAWGKGAIEVFKRRYQSCCRPMAMQWPAQWRSSITISIPVEIQYPKFHWNASSMGVSLLGAFAPLRRKNLGKVLLGQISCKNSGILVFHTLFRAKMSICPQWRLGFRKGGGGNPLPYSLPLTSPFPSLPLPLSIPPFPFPLPSCPPFPSLTLEVGPLKSS